MTNLQGNNTSNKDLSENGDELLSTKQVAEILAERDGRSMTSGQVVREIKGRYIPAEQIGGKGKGFRYLVRRSSLNKYQRRSPGRRPGSKRKKAKATDFNE